MNDVAIADSNYLVALFDERDVWHRQATELGDALKVGLVFLDCVMNEVYSVICKRALDKSKGDVIPGIIEKIERSVGEETMIWSYETVKENYGEVIGLLKKHDGRLNFHDCLIALFARENNIGSIVSFDRDFDEVEWLERLSGH